jgi:DIM1 family U5 snRNP protein
MDETLYGVAEKLKNFAIIYLVDLTEVPDFNKMYELYDPCTVMFFYRKYVYGFFKWIVIVKLTL